MVKRGSITVFLALTLGLILSLLSSGLESARMAAARTQILNGMDIGLYSLFGQYDKLSGKTGDDASKTGTCRYLHFHVIWGIQSIPVHSVPFGTGTGLLDRRRDRGC